MAQAPNYTNSIPSLPEVGDEAAREFLAPTRANGVVVGTPVMRQHRHDALHEEQAKARKCNPDSITQDEIFDAQLRRQELEQEIAAAEGRVGAVAPPWAVLMNNQLNQVQNQLNVFQNQVNVFQNQLNARLTAMSQNALIRSINKVEGPAMIPIRKEIAGSGDHLVALISPIQVALPPQLAQIPAVGEQPDLLGAGGIFPDDLDTLLKLTHHQVLQVVQFYNDDFGILQGDNLAIRIRKLIFFFR